MQVNVKLGAGDDAIERLIKPQVKAAVRHALKCAKGSLDARPGQFCLMSCDVLIDAGLNVHVLGMSRNTSLEMHKKVVHLCHPSSLKHRVTSLVLTYVVCAVRRTWMRS